MIDCTANAIQAFSRFEFDRGLQSLADRKELKHTFSILFYITHLNRMGNRINGSGGRLPLVLNW
jgi:hypothetical protein